MECEEDLFDCETHDDEETPQMSEIELFIDSNPEYRKEIMQTVDVFARIISYWSDQGIY